MVANLRLGRRNKVAHIQRSSLIHAPAENIFDYIAKPDNMHAWNRNLVGNWDLPEGPIAAGTSWTQVYKIAYLTIELRRRVLKYERPHRIVWELTAPEGRLVLTFKLQPMGNGTRVTWIADYRLRGGLLGRFADRLLLEREVKRASIQNLAKLKAILQKGVVTKC